MMAWRVYIDEKHPRVVMLVNQGTLTLQDYREQIAEAWALGQQEGIIDFCVDDRDLAPRMSILEVYQFPAIYSEVGVDRSAKIAVIMNPKLADSRSLRFYEDVCRNEGYNVTLFDTEDQAFAWLERVPGIPSSRGGL